MFAQQRLQDVRGPSALAVDAAGRLYVASHGAVHAFAPDGERIGVHPCRNESPVCAEVSNHSVATVRWNGRLVVADAAGFRVDLRTRDAHPGLALDARFTAELAQAQDDARAWRRARLASQAGVVAVPLLAIVLLRALGVAGRSRWRRPIAMSARGRRTLPAKGMTWMAVRPAHLASVLRRQASVRALLLATVLAGPVLLYGASGLPFLRNTGMFALAVAVVAMAAFVMGTLTLGARARVERLGAMRLGASSEGLSYVATRTDREEAMVAGGPVPWNEVHFDGFRLLARGQSITAKHAIEGEVFPRAAFEREILARIPAANVVSSGALLFRWLRH